MVGFGGLHSRLGFGDNTFLLMFPLILGQMKEKGDFGQSNRLDIRQGILGSGSLVCDLRTSL